MSSSIEVSIVIVCMNKPENLRPCLTSVRKHTSIAYETFVVAYMFSEENLRQMRDEFPWANFIVSDEPRGFSENNNLALRKCRGRFCFVLNDDAVLLDDAVGALVEDFSLLGPRTAIVSPKLLNSDDSLQLCGRPEYPARRYALQQWHLYSEPLDDTVGKTPVCRSIYRTSNICGAAFLIRTEYFRSLGWFDEKYFFTPEDIALSVLARKRGYGVFVDTASAVIHNHRSTAGRLAPAVRPAAVRGSLMFFSGGSSVRYLLLAIPVWLAETSKRLKACGRNLLHPTEQNAFKLRTFRNISRSIFTHRTPKELFLKYSAGMPLKQKAE